MTDVGMPHEVFPEKRHLVFETVAVDLLALLCVGGGGAGEQLLSAIPPCPLRIVQAEFRRFDFDREETIRRLESFGPLTDVLVRRLRTGRSS